MQWTTERSSGASVPAARTFPAGRSRPSAFRVPVSPVSAWFLENPPLNGGFSRNRLRADARPRGPDRCGAADSPFVRGPPGGGPGGAKAVRQDDPGAPDRRRRDRRDALRPGGGHRQAAPAHAGAALAPLSGLVVIDEIQRQPELFETLRVLIDRPGSTTRFLLLGSASPALARGASETLAGRVGRVRLAGFGLTDTAGRGLGGWRRLWWRGGFPRSFLASDDGLSALWREDFLKTFLERDIPQLGIRLPAETLRRFWIMVAHSHGQVCQGMAGRRQRRGRAVVPQSVGPLEHRRRGRAHGPYGAPSAQGARRSRRNRRQDLRPLRPRRLRAGPRQRRGRANRTHERRQVAVADHAGTLRSRSTGRTRSGRQTPLRRRQVMRAAAPFSVAALPSRQGAE